MADMTKQRLIGALLVLTVILVSAVLLIQSANQNVSETEQVSLPGVESSIDSGEIERVDPDAEVLLNPHALPTTTESTMAQAEVTEVEKHQNSNDVPAVVIPEITSVKPTPAPVDVEKIVEKKPTPITEPIVAPSAAAGPEWLIQVASFGVKDNAYALQKKLRLLNIESQVEGQQNSQGKMIYRVKVGPVQQQSRVDKTVADIKQHLKLTPQVKQVEAP